MLKIRKKTGSSDLFLTHSDGMWDLYLFSFGFLVHYYCLSSFYIYSFFFMNIIRGDSNASVQHNNRRRKARDIHWFTLEQLQWKKLTIFSLSLSPSPSPLSPSLSSLSYISFPLFQFFSLYNYRHIWADGTHLYLLVQMKNWILKENLSVWGNFGETEWVNIAMRCVRMVTSATQRHAASRRSAQSSSTHGKFIHHHYTNNYTISHCSIIPHYITINTRGREVSSSMLFCWCYKQ